MMDVRNAVIEALAAVAAAMWRLWNLPAALAAACAQCREEERDLRAKAADAGVPPEEYRRRQMETEAAWAASLKGGRP